MKILLELRPALDGHAGIPQETRLLFRALNLLDGIEAEGLIQSSGRVLGKALPVSKDSAHNPLSRHQQVNRLSRVVVSLEQNAKATLSEKLGSTLGLYLHPTAMLLRRTVGLEETLWHFDASHFKDFVWRSLFAKTLPFEDFEAVTSASYRVVRVPWTAMHTVALLTLKFGATCYPRLDTSNFDVMISETPYPATVSKNTRLVVRYHDAIPVLMPHTISDKSFHQASHYQALRLNVAKGAYFACVSDATRRDLISIFPEAEPRSVTIPNMVSQHYFPEESSAIRIPEIFRARALATVRMRTIAAELQTPLPSNSSEPLQLDYLLMVSTIEPRKNHLTLLSAWEQLRTESFPKLKLVVVGMLGWDHKAIVSKFRPWLERGELVMLADVLASELRLLYRHAQATVCPSFGEGFDFSGVEAMRCGGAVVASDIAVHRDVFGDAAQYFSPYSATETAWAIKEVIDPSAPARRQDLIAKGARVSERYLPKNVLPQWHEFLHSLKP